VGASARYAAALVGVLAEVDLALGEPDRLDVVDVGSGSGRLLDDLARECPDPLRTKLVLTAVELGSRPSDLSPDIGWTAELPAAITGLVVANEWLDNVPVDLVELTESGPRLVLVDPVTGTERLGDAPDDADVAWLRQWWPLHEIGQRAEVGRPRDVAWAGVVGRLERGLAIAADYDHRLPHRPEYPTLAGYRDGRAVDPVPDGSCDVTAHVALDACAAAGSAAGATASLLTTQRDALRALGLLGRRPPVELAGSDPRAYLSGLRRAGEEAELIDRGGLGGFGWLVQAVGIYLPAALAGTMVG
jgi:SAM-dependent MidA family methyltransferase